MARRRLRKLAACALLASGLVLAQPQPQPQPQHLGVASCASTQCHGSASPASGREVQQNEYVTWAHFDPHARSYRVLLESRAVEMARRLGLGAAHETRECLDCHADTVDAGQRGPRFQLSDGVGCESCHGAAQAWIASHDDGGSDRHERNLGAGMARLEDPEVRARLCLGCHLGDESRFATHRMMAAGHPRLSFELDTFTELWRTSGGREHFRRDAAPEGRKAAAPGSRVWLTGLLTSARLQLDLLRGPRASSFGGLPDFALYNCYSCHRAMRFQPGDARGLASDLAPGSLRLDDSRLVMLSAVFAAVSPEDDRELRMQTAQLHRSAGSGRDAIESASSRLDRHLEEAGARVGRRLLTIPEQNAILRQLLDAANRGAYGDYAAAEQAAMAIVLLLAETGGDEAVQPEIDALFEALADDARYNAARFSRILERMKK